MVSVAKALQEASELDAKQNSAADSSEEQLTDVVSEEVEPVPAKGHPRLEKEEDVSDGSKGAAVSSKKQGSHRKFSLSDGTQPGSESDEDSVRTSSSQRSHEIKMSTSSEKEKEKDSRKSSASLKTEEPAKSSSRSRSDRDDKYSRPLF